MTWNCELEISDDCAGGDMFDAPATVDGVDVCLACASVARRDGGVSR